MPLEIIGHIDVENTMYKPTTEDNTSWHVLWTKSNCEQQVHEQLLAKGFNAYLPQVSRWSQRRGQRYLSQTPMFPGYLFLRHDIDKESYIDISKTKGLVRILGDRWDRLPTVDDGEIEDIRKLTDAQLPALPHPYLSTGRRVRVVRGPLMNATGILAKYDAQKGILVLSIDLLKQSVAVQVDCTSVEPL